MPVTKHSLEEGAENSPTDKKKRKRSRWANDETEKTFIPGMPTTLPADATDEQKEQYLLQLQIEDASRRLRSGDLGIPANPEDRSPSPEPIYNNEGKRMNTREYRVRKALEEERHEKIQKLLGLNANYKPPADYKPPIVRVHDKVMIPQDDHPEINFVGLLIGPRGNTLKNLEKETGAKIIIRGKGSVKEGKIGRKDGQPLPGEDEPLHAYITANDPENVKKAVQKIHEIIKEGIEIPEEKNDLRKQQLRELALLNGTLRDNDGLQKLRQIAEAQTIVTNQIVCTKCGAAGHIAKDCVQKTPAELASSAMVANSSTGDLPANTVVGRQDRAKMDSEYMSLMAELGQVAPETVKADIAANMPKPAATVDHTPKGSQYDLRPPGTQGDGPPGLSSDYGYGGKRSRFDEFNNSKFSNSSYYGSSGPRPQTRFDQPPLGYNSSSSGNPPPFNHSMPPPPPGFNQTPHSSWNNPPPPGSMMNSNRWGSPAANPPPPPHISAAAPPPPGVSTTSYAAPPPPPPSTSSWSQSTASNAPWQTTSAPLPPWQQPSSYSNAAAPPPPPPPPGSGSYSSYSSYGSAPLPPPPPPQ